MIAKLFCSIPDSTQNTSSNKSTSLKKELSSSSYETCTTSSLIHDNEYQDNWGWDGLHYYARWGLLDGVRKIVYENLSDINVKSKKSNWTALHFASGFGHTHVVKFLLQNNVDCYTKDNKGFTASEIATKFKHYGIVALINEHISTLKYTEDERRVTRSQDKHFPQDIAEPLSNSPVSCDIYLLCYFILNSYEL